VTPQVATKCQRSLNVVDDTVLADQRAAVAATVDAWAADNAAGQQTAMFAWRRANVDALNQAARIRMEQTGRLTGPEVICPGGAAYRAGDEVVSLAPGPGGTLLTSERGVVEAVDPSAGSLVIRTREGGEVTFTGDQACATRLTHAYATTVHRSPRRNDRKGPPVGGRRRPGTRLRGHEQGPRIDPYLDRRRRPRPSRGRPSPRLGNQA
jgi:hypothetical protein